jgi:hypothetical protein
MTTKTTTKPAPVQEPAAVEEAPQAPTAQELGILKAQKYWTATTEQIALRDQLLADMGLKLEDVERQTFAAAWDVDRYYTESTGPSPKNPQVRALARALRAGGCKAHAVAFLTGIPPRFVGTMWAPVKAEAPKADEALAATGTEG